VLNLQRLGVSGACDAVQKMVTLDKFKPTAESMARMEDLSLSCRVWAAMAKNPDVRSAGVHVAAERGEVLVTGSVRSQKALELIPHIVKDVEGVESLRCEIGIGSDWYW
jgi:osmotically-inducible protein OsmY